MPGLERLSGLSMRRPSVRCYHDRISQGKAAMSAVVHAEVPMHSTDSSCDCTLQCPQIATDGELDIKVSVSRREMVLGAVECVLMPLGRKDCSWQMARARKLSG